MYNQYEKESKIFQKQIFLLKVVKFMLTNQINPFVRYAFVLRKTPENKLVKNADCRIYYFIEGQGEIIADGETKKIEKDSVVILRSGTNYRWNIENDKNISIAIINFDYTQEHSKRTHFFHLIPEDMFDLSEVYYTEDFEDAEILNKPLVLKNMHRFKKDMLEVTKEYEEKKPFSIETANAILHLILIKIIRYADFSNTDKNSKIEPLLDYIHLNFDKEITNISLGGMMNYHPHYINSLMKEYTGTTLHSYLTEYRMNEALKLLVNTDYSIEIISQKVGYKNPTHFCANFKKKFGISPSVYRKTSKLG